jgi:RNA polymerase sigma-70 factor (ECF subfamily)
MSEPAELELLQRIQQGDEEALLVLHRRYAGLVYSIAYRVLGEQMAAEEVTQDTFLRLWRRADTFDPARGEFVPWLVTIARRQAIDTLRRQQRDPLRDPLFLDDHPDAWENALPADDAQSTARHLLRDAAAALPDEQRQTIEMAYFGGMSHSQIAARLGVPLGTVKTRLRLGMEKLRAAWLGETDEDPPASR